MRLSLLAQEIVQRLTSDPSTLERLTELLQRLLAQQHTYDSLLLLLNRLLADPAFKSTVSTFTGVYGAIGIADDCPPFPGRTQTLTLPLAPPSPHTLTQFPPPPHLSPLPVTMPSWSGDTLVSEYVTAQAILMASNITHTVLHDAAIQEHASEFVQSTLSDKSL